MQLTRNGYHDVPAGQDRDRRDLPRDDRAAGPAPGRRRARISPCAGSSGPIPSGTATSTVVIGEDWLWFSRLRLTDEELARVIRHPRVEVWVLSRDGVDVGLLELDRRTPGDVELLFFGLAPELVGGGAGRFLMERAIEIAWSTAPRRFWLHTCTLDHPAALAFYRRSGLPRLSADHRDRRGSAPDGRAAARRRPARPDHSLRGRQLETGVSGWAPHSDQEPS